jgi:hypothetical protein
MTQPTYELFDKFGRYCFNPDAAAIEAMDPRTRELYQDVKVASQALNAAKSKREAAEQAITDAIAERDDAERELKRVRPKITHTQLAKEFIASEQAKR